MGNEITYNPTDFKIRILYSSALCFGKSSSNPICQYKEQLSKVLKRSDMSLNAEPHITFNSFLGDGRELSRARNYLNSFCAQIEPFKIRLNRFDVFEDSGTIFLALDDQSYEHVSRIMKSLHFGRIVKADKKCKPHLTIAKGLSEQDLKIAKQLFIGQTVDIHLECHHLSLRKRNWDEFQFSVINNFQFKGLKENLLFF